MKSKGRARARAIGGKVIRSIPMDDELWSAVQDAARKEDMSAARFMRVAVVRLLSKSGGGS